MTERPLGVPCVYCGGRHARAAEVRDCWQRSGRPGALGGAPLPPAGEAPTAVLPSHDEAGPLRVLPQERSARLPTTEPCVAEARVGGPGGQTLAIAALGRSVVVAPGQAPPGPWQDCQRAGAGTEELEQAWRDRVPLVIELDEEPVDHEVEHAPVWSLAPSFSFPGERRAHVLFTNAVDARAGDERWRWSEEAARLGATVQGPADVVLPDGRPAFCDGGPLEWRSPVGDAVVVHRMALLAGSLVPFGANRSDAALAPDQLASRRPPGRRRSHHRPGRVGQDAGPHRARPSPAPAVGPPGSCDDPRGVQQEGG